MKKALLMILMLILACVTTKAQIYLVDEDTNEAVNAASIFNNETGKLIGLTNEKGALPAEALKIKNLTVQHINYGSKQISAADIVNDTILIKALTFNIPGITVNKDQKMILRMKAYTRSYSFVDNQPVAISEGIRNLYFKNSDEEKNPKIKTVSERAFVDREYYDSQSMWIQAIADPDYPMFFKIKNYALYDTLKNDRKLSVYDKKGKRFVVYMKEDAKNQTCEIVTDSGFVEAPFNMPLFRLSFTNLYINEKYNIKNGSPKLANLLSFTRMMRIVLNKSKRFVDLVDEYYPMEFEYITKEKMTEERKDKSTKPFARPENMPGLNPLMEKAIKKCH